MKELRWFYEIARVPLSIFTRFVLRLHAEGMEHVPATGPVIIVCNHLHMMDILAVSVPCKRQEHFMAKAELFKIPIFNTFIRLLGAFPVRRGESDRDSLRTALDVLAAGQVLVMFPEGHRSDTHTLQRGLTGVALIAMRSGAPIVPVGIAGTERAFKGLRVGPWAPRVRVVYGEPFTLPSTGRRTREDLERGLDLLMRRIAALLPPEYRGVYAEPGPAPVGAAPSAAGLNPGGADPLAAESALDAGQQPPDERTPPASA